MTIKHKSGYDLSKLIKDLESTQVKTGYFAGSTYTDGKPVAGIAAVHESGSPTMGIPPRPTLSSLKASRSELQGVSVLAYRRSIQSGSVAAEMEAVGLQAQAIVRQAIADTTSPALDPRTVAARARRHSSGKATDKPLIDTRTMLRSVESVVESK